jgi:hypothetical protein
MALGASQITGLGSPHACTAFAATCLFLHAVLPTTYTGPQGWKFWDGVLHNPTSLKLPQLKEAARALGVQVTGSKPELVVRLLGAFGLSAPVPAAVPARLMRILQLERTRIDRLFVYDGSEEGCEAIWAAVGSMRTARQPAGLAAFAALRGSGTGGLAAARRVLVEAGISTMQLLQEAQQQAEQQLQDETPEQQRAREAAEQAEQQAQLMQLLGGVEQQKQAKWEKEQLAGQLYRQYTGGASGRVWGGVHWMSQRGNMLALVQPSFQSGGHVATAGWWLCCCCVRQSCMLLVGACGPAFACLSNKCTLLQSSL